MNQSTESYSFGEWQFSPLNRELIGCDKHTESLGNRASEVLRFLIVHQDRVCKYDEILNAVWGTDVFVDQGSVNQAVMEIRQKLELLRIGLNGKEIIKNRSGIGYRFNYSSAVKPGSSTSDVALMQQEQDGCQVLSTKLDSGDGEPITPQIVRDAVDEEEPLLHEESANEEPVQKSNLQNADDTKPINSQLLLQGHRKTILTMLVKTTCLTCILLAGNWMERNTAVGNHLQWMTHGILQKCLSLRFHDNNVPVQIVDMSQSAQLSTTKGTIPLTSRAALRDLLIAVAENRPRAIGVDLDFSPDEAGNLAPEDIDFFDFCLRLRNVTKIPIFLGIFRSQAMPASAWLGKDSYKDLAASILVPRDARWMPKWLHASNDFRSFGLSASLTGVHEDTTTLPSSLTWALEPERTFQEQHFSARVFLVDYGSLVALSKNALQPTSPDAIRSQGRQIQGKIVVVGDLANGTRDIFVVPGYPDYVPGVLVHACGTYTLLGHPLYLLTYWGNVIVNLVISLIVVGGFALIGRKFRYRVPAPQMAKRFQMVFILLSAVFVMIMPAASVHISRVVWDDFFLVAFVLIGYGLFETAFGA